MTAPKQKPTLTPERVQWFADYLRSNRNGGVFWPMTLGNYGAPAQLAADTPADVREVAEWFGQLTPSQRRRLRERAEDFANTIRRSA